MSTSPLTYAGRGARRVGSRCRLLGADQARIAVLVLVTVRRGVCRPAGERSSRCCCCTRLIGTALGRRQRQRAEPMAGARTDALMPRTADRPLPAGRLAAARCSSSASRRSSLGVAYSGLAGQSVDGAAWAWTWFLYVCVYTPLKSRTPANTVVGAVAGALPVLMGWAAVGRAAGR